MKKPLYFGVVLFTSVTTASHLSAEEVFFNNKQPLLLAETQNPEPVPAGFHRMPDGSLMANQSNKSVTVDDLSGVLPSGYHVMQDGTVMANDPANAVAPNGYELRSDGTLLKTDSKPKSANINDFNGMIPPSFHMKVDGTIVANDTMRSKAPEGYHMMPDGTLMPNAGSANAHAHHTSGGHHGAGMWMFEYKYMRMAMDGLKDSDLKVDPMTILFPEYNFDAAPTKMNMDMHMFMLMYGLTDKITLMGMTHYIVNDMEMLIHTNGDTTTMRSSGIGDTLLSASLKLTKNLEFGFGLNLPTGSIKEKGTMEMYMSSTGTEPTSMNMLYPYAMQLGSGTVDIIPSILYQTSWEKFNFGGEVSYTMRTKKADVEFPYRLGNLLEANLFTEWKMHKNVELNAKIGLLSMDQIDGETNTNLLHGANGAGSPASHPELYGGTRIDATFGAKFKTSDQMYYVKPEFGIPIYQNLWGPQMRTSWIFSAAIGAMF